MPSIKFQSLRGFGVGWSVMITLVASAPTVVSIPERVWGGLEPHQLNSSSLRLLFQSLRGFGVGWSTTKGVSSLSSDEFQSLRGFGVGWSRVVLAARSGHCGVSIPERVWGGLERPTNSGNGG